LNLVGHQRCQRRPAAANKDMLHFEAVFIEKVIFQRGIKMRESTRHGAGSDTDAYRTLAGSSKIRVGIGRRDAGKQETQRE